MLVSEVLWKGIVGVIQVLYSTPSSSNGVQDIVMDVIVVLPNTTSDETLGAFNSMAPGGSNHLDNLLLLYKATYH